MIDGMVGLIGERFFLTTELMTMERHKFESLKHALDLSMNVSQAGVITLAGFHMFFPGEGAMKARWFAIEYSINPSGLRVRWGS